MMILSSKVAQFRSTSTAAGVDMKGCSVREGLCRAATRSNGRAIGANIAANKSITTPLVV